MSATDDEQAGEIEKAFKHEVLEFTYEFLDNVSRHVVVRDGPFILIRGVDGSACYEITDDEPFRRAVIAVRRRVT